MITSSAILDFESENFTVGDWNVSFVTGELSSGARVVKLSQSQRKLLQLLCQSYPEAVSRQRIMEILWPESVVTDESVSRAIADLRKSLGDSSKEALYIKTISKQGYVLAIPPVKTLSVSKIPWQLKLAAISVIVLVVFSIAYFLNQRLTTPELQQKKFVKSSLGLSGDINRRPQIDHAGRFVMVEKHHGTAIKLWLYDLALDTETLLFPKSKDSFSTGVISPDGLELAYFRHLNENADKGFKCHIEVFTFKTQKSRKLRDCDFRLNASLQWFPDNEHLLATGFRPDVRTAGLIIVDAFLGKSEELLFPSKNRQGYLFSRVSPSGNLIAFIHYDANSDTSKIAIYNRTEESLNYIPTSTPTAQQVIWGKDDTQLLFSDSGATNTGLWLVDLTTSSKFLLYGESLIDFDFTPAKNLFVATIEDYSVSIVSQKLATSSVLFNANAKIRILDSMPGSNQLAYVSEQGGQANIWLLDKKTQQNTRITNLSKIKLFEVKLSYNGRYLAYLQSEAAGTKMVVIDLEQGYQEIHQAQQVHTLAWDKNNDTLVYYHGDEQGRLMSIDFKSRQHVEAKEVARIDNVYKLELSQAGALIVQFVKGGPLYLLKSDFDSASTDNFEVLNLPEREYTLWGISGNTITRIEYSDDMFRLHVYDLDGSELKDQQRIVDGTKHIIDFSYDERVDELFLLQIERANFNIVKLTQYNKH
jgi:DNA-binding winged helix-turn-helix (wHTH) protein/Tol biopolymer transport system component